VPRASFLDGVRVALEFVVGGIMMAAVFLNAANVVARYVFFRPIVPAEEILQYMNVWIVLLGLATITRDGRHLQMDVVYQLMGPRLRRAADAVSLGLELGASAYVIVQAGRAMEILYASGQTSVTAGIPVVLMYAALPVGFGCSVLFLLARAAKLARGDASAVVA
jgi:TRAP-type C4-dicarboxylate transport system permease small subunit